MSHLKIFINLTRLNKPIGFMLLFWPCSWGLAYAYQVNNNTGLLIYYLFLFFLGSVLMRSAGCIVNDIVDKDYDRKVSRTKKRPIASGSLNKTTAWIYVLILCLLNIFFQDKYFLLSVIITFLTLN